MISSQVTAGNGCTHVCVRAGAHGHAIVPTCRYLVTWRPPRPSMTRLDTTRHKVYYLSDTMPSPHPTLGLRIPAPLYDAVKERAAELGTTANTFILLLLASELGFGDSTNNEVTKWLLSNQRAKEQQPKGASS